MGEQSTEILEKFKPHRDELIALLQGIQEKCGYISEKSVSDLAQYLKISENEVFAVASFYTQFKFIPSGENILKVCTGTSCHVKGGENILESLERTLNVKVGGTTQDGKFSLERVACLGCCALAPVIMVNDTIYGRINQKKIKKILKIRQKAKFEIYKDARGDFRFRLRAPNNEIIAVSEGYTSKAACLNGVNSIRRNAPLASIKESLED